MLLRAKSALLSNQTTSLRVRVSTNKKMLLTENILHLYGFLPGTVGLESPSGPFQPSIL